MRTRPICFRLLKLALQLLLCCSCLTQVKGQTSYHIGLEHGLAATPLTTIIRDHNGYMWFGSYNGLYQHQGNHIRRYSRVGMDSASLSGGEMHAIYEDRNSNIWVGTIGGLDRLNPVTGLIRHYRLYAGADSSLNIGYIYAIFEDRERFIWVSTDAGIFRLTAASGAYRQFVQGESDTSVPANSTGYRQGLGNKQGFLISTSRGPAFYSYRTHAFTHRYNNSTPFYSLEHRSHSASSDMCMDDSGRIYLVMNANQLVRFHPATGQLDTFGFTTPEGSWYCCYSMARDHRGAIWLGFRHGGILVFNPISKTFKAIRQESQDGLIQSNYIYGMCEDYQNQMWVTTDNGIDVIDYYDHGKQLFQLSDSADFTKLAYSSALMSYDGRGKLVIPFEAGIRFVFTTDSSKVSRQQIPKPQQVASYNVSVLPDDTYLDEKNRSFESLTAVSGFHRSVNATWVYESQGIRYEKYQDGILTRIERDGRVTHLHSTGWTKQAHISRDGSRIYFMNRKWDVIIQDIVSGTMDTLKTGQAIAKAGSAVASSRDLSSDGQGDIWITMQNGLIRYDTASRKARVYSTADGLSGNFTYSVVTDNSGIIWVASIGGVDWYDAASDRFRNVMRFKDATYMDAFGSNLKTPDGSLYFHFGNRLLRIRPELLLSRARIRPKLLLQEVLVNGRQIGGSQDPFLQQLSRHDNRISFRYGLLDFRDVSNGIRIQYRLNKHYRIGGSVAEWTNSEDGEAMYSALSPGQYEFQVRALSPDGRTLYELLRVPFYIRPAFWQTWWATTIVLLIVAGIVSLLVRRRIASIRTKAALQQQMMELESRALRSQMNPHFLFNSLNAIQELVIREDTTAAYEYLSKFSKLLRMVLHHAEQSSILLIDEIAMYELYLALEELRFNHTFSYRIRIDDPVDAETVRIPPMLLQPYLENAIWHGLMHRSGSKVLDLHFTGKGDAVICTVTDNGIGREAAARIRKGRLRPHGDTSRGMSLSAQRIALLSGGKKEADIVINDLADEDGRPAGTQVIVTLPIGEADPESDATC